jgi:N-acetylglucosamine-6-sulfatase
MVTRLQGFLALFSALLAGLFAFAGEALANGRPNIVVVQVDDMARSLLGPTLRDGRPAMPNLQGLIAGEGANFTNYYNTTPLCSPSRSVLLSGQYGRNSGVVGNNGQFGGWPGWQGREILDSNLATMLQGEGYHTAHVGKFLNHYHEESVDPLVVPPGWNTWISDATDQSTRDFYGYQQLVRVERNGEVVEGTSEGELRGPYGDPNYANNEGIDPKACEVTTEETNGSKPCNYHTDRMTRLAAREIREVDEPLFLQVDYHAPHADNTPPSGPQPATRHLGLADRVPLPRGPAFNEPNTSDKSYLAKRNNGRLRPGMEKVIETIFRTGLESLRAVDEGIGYLIETLEETGKLDDTYFVFVSDNGFFYGDHRFPWSKLLAYEPSARVPLLIRGPDIARADSASLANTADLAPTILDVAGVDPDYAMDGESLVPLLRGETPRRSGKRALLIERLVPVEMNGETLPKIERKKLDPNRPQGRVPNLPYRALRIGRHKYISYTQGGEELYDLRRDPHELYNQSRNPEYLELLDYMRAMLERYRDCAGPSCLAEPDDPPEPGRFLLDARRPPARLSTKVAYLYRDRVHAKLKCRSSRTCRETVAVRYRGERVTERVTVRIRAGQGQRVRLPATSTGEVRLQRASEREARIELRRSSSDPVSGTKIRVSRPVLRQN